MARTTTEQADLAVLRAAVREQRKVIMQLSSACNEALQAIAACWNYVDFHTALGDTAREIESALELASGLEEIVAD